MIKRPPRNAITSQRRVAKSPFNPLFNPDLQPALETSPGFPPDTDGFIVSTFPGRFPLQEDFFFRLNQGLIVNATDDDIANATYGDAWGMRAPPGYRLIVRNIYIPSICSINVNATDPDNEAPFTPAGGVTQIGVWDIQGPYLGVYLDENPVQSILNYDQLLQGFPLFDPSEALIYGPVSIDCFVRVESGSILFLRQFENPELVSNPGSASFSYLLPFVEIRGQIEAVDNYELQTLGLTKKPVPTSEAEGLRLMRKRAEGRNQ